MKPAIWASTFILTFSLAVGPGLDFPRGASSEIERAWWAVPFSAALLSLLVAGAVRLGSMDDGGKKWERAATVAYLFAGPSCAALGIAPLLSLAPYPPVWVGPLASLLFFSSAGGYYLSSREPEDESARQTIPSWSSVT